MPAGAKTPGEERMDELEERNSDRRMERRHSRAAAEELSCEPIEPIYWPSQAERRGKGDSDDEALLRQNAAKKAVLCG